MFVAIVILAAIFIIIYGNRSYAADETKVPNKGFKSEEELLDNTRRTVVQHLGDKESEVRAAKKIIIEEVPKEEVELPAVKEEPVVKEAPAAPVANETPIAKEESVTPAAKQEPVAPIVKEEPAIKEEPVAPSAKEDPPAIEQDPPKEEKPQGIPSDVTQVSMAKDVQTAATNPQAPEEIVFSETTKKPMIIKGAEEPVLKKMDVNRIGASPYYETYEGLRLLKYFTVAQRVEIYQEPRPIDAYMMDAQALRIMAPNTPWNIKSDYRTQLVPIFTRAYGTEITMSDPKNKEGQLRYTLDYRNIYKNYFPKYPTIKEEIWDQNEILLMHAKIIEPINWLYTSNIGYRFSTMNDKENDVWQQHAYYEIRHTYLASLSLAPTDKVEYFFQGEYYKSMHVKCTYDYRPDHFLGRTEIRIKSKDYKTTFVPQFSFSKDLYYPFSNTFEKYEIAFRAGRDWTKRFSSTHTVQYVYSFRDEPDNQGPTFYNTSFKNPHRDKGEYVTLENRFSYNVYDRLYTQAGLDITNGLNWSIYDNVGFLGGIEYYAPGIIRVDFGWRGNYYYGLDDFMSSLYFKFYLFM